MKIAVLGTGSVGRAISARLVELGHDVRMGTRNPTESLNRTETDQMGNPPLSTWLAQNSKIALVTFAEAASGSEWIVNATNGAASLEVLRAAEAKHLAGKVLIDISNPLGDESGFPPSLFVSNTDSLGEQIQREFPETKVVKTLNTMNNQLMIHPLKLANGDHSVFLSGNDKAAKESVVELLRTFGWADIVDLGDISTARGPEMYMALWLRMWGALQIPMFQIKVVK
ncbi:MAG: NAD(P)-binding domain-containing protein [Anaerolineales bacterium]